MYDMSRHADMVQNILEKAAFNNIAAKTGVLHPSGEQKHEMNFQLNDVHTNAGTGKPQYKTGVNFEQSHLAENNNYTNIGFSSDSDDDGRVDPADILGMSPSNYSMQGTSGTTIRTGGNSKYSSSKPSSKKQTSTQAAYNRATAAGNVRSARSFGEARSAYNSARANLKTTTRQR
jgi:hypothetical protein